MSNQSNQGNRIAIVVIIIVVVLAGAAGAWYWLMYKPEQEAKEKARLEQIAKAEAEKKRQEEAAQKKANYDKLIANADTEFGQGNWETAQSLYTDALALFPNESYPHDQLTLVNAELDEIAEREARIAAGIVETISSPTGRFYVIISSSIDDDLAMDYASKLAKEGNDVKIVEHVVNELSFFGVSLGDYDTWDQAVSASTSQGSSFDGGAWVLKF